MFGNKDDQQDNQQQNGGDQPQDAGTAPVVSADPAQAAPAGDSQQNDVNLTLPSAPAPIGSVTAPDSGAHASAPVASDELLDIKQSALQQLSPLVGHLDQTPEEKFRTTMMMIQATDDHGKIKEAYDAAVAIPDDKVRAQALLDVVNEINYFTQQHHDGPSPHEENK
jgi:hypothetical protein